MNAPLYETKSHMGATGGRATRQSGCWSRQEGSEAVDGCGFRFVKPKTKGLLGSGGASVAAVVRQVGKPPYGHG